MGRSSRATLPPRKHSAGLLLVSGGRLLLLRRCLGRTNGGRWGLPGGRLDAGEAPWTGALREATEELGWLPDADVLGELRVFRAGGRKRFDVFACRASASARHWWAPRLDAEHDRYLWADLGWCRLNRRDLHPVVRRLLEEPTARRAISRVVASRPLTRHRGAAVSVRQSQGRLLAA